MLIFDEDVVFRLLNYIMLIMGKKIKFPLLNERGMYLKYFFSF